jgi:hypothetical protein
LEKEAKTFVNCGAGCITAHAKQSKFFGSFFQKRTLTSARAAVNAI